MDTQNYNFQMDANNTDTRRTRSGREYDLSTHANSSKNTGMFVYHSNNFTILKIRFFIKNYNSF